MVKDLDMFKMYVQTKNLIVCIISMKSKLLSVYTDASGDDSKGTIAFSVWYRGKCLGRFTSVLNDYDCGNSSVLELIVDT